MKKMNKNTSGSAILTALGMGFVLLIVITSLRSFSSYRIQNTITENRNLKALALAEAGISFAITELGLNSAFRTNEVKIDTAKKEILWDKPVKWNPLIANESSFSFSRKNSDTIGTYHGTLGDGEFKFRVGWIPCLDDPRTKNIDESKCYFKIESIGRVGDTTRTVNCVVQRRFPGREFLMFDMEFLTLVYGEPNDSKNVNKFTSGNLYGHKGVEISRILLISHHDTGAGTRQELYDIQSIISGTGGVFFWSPTKVEFRAQPGLLQEILTLQSDFEFPRPGTYKPPESEEWGGIPEELKGRVSSFKDEATLKPKLKGRILDKTAGITLSPAPPNFEEYKKRAQSGGKYISASECNVQYKLTPNWHPSQGPSNAPYIKAKLLDFGNSIHSPSPDASLPDSFNGVIYSDENLIIKGNPPRDVKIVSKKSIFVAGDFNQRNDTTRKEERYCFPQNYDGIASEAYDYTETSKKLLYDDVENGTFKHHFAANVIANERVLYDYRSPVDCFENELYPFMKFALAKKFMSAADAENSMLKVSGSGGITADFSDKEAVKNKIASYFEDFPLKDADKEKNIEENFANLVSNDGINNENFEKFCKETLWPAYRSTYENHCTERSHGVYQLLDGLRKKIENSPDKHDDYLFFPEMTTNGIFQSCGVRANRFYRGPDYSGRFDEIGNLDGYTIGVRHSELGTMLHRLFGSEVRYATNADLERIEGNSYNPPVRRKVYDPTLPKLNLGDGNDDIAAFVILTWKDSRSSSQEFASF